MDPTTDQPARRCPECGTLASEVTPHIAWWWRWRRVFQAAVLLAYVVFLGVMQWRHWPVPSTLMTPRPPGVGGVELPAERITRGELEAMARGEGGAGDAERLFRAMNARLEHRTNTADAELWAAIVAPAGDATAHVRWGWPVAVVTRASAGTYDDVYERRGLVAPNLRGRTGWIGGAWWDESIHPVLGRETLVVSPLRLVTVVCMLIVGWMVLRVVAGALALVPWFRTGGRSGGLVRWLPGVGVAAMLAAITVLSFIPFGQEGLRMPALPWPQTGPTGLTVAELRAMRGGPDAGRDLARAILDGASLVPSDGDALVIAWHRPHSELSYQVEGLWPAGLYYGHVATRRYEGSEPATPWGDSDWSLHLDRLTVSLIRQEVGGPQRYRQHTISLEHAAWPLLGLVGAWIVPGIPFRVAMGRLRRRTRRRVARGHCARCGYDAARPAGREAAA